MTSGSQVTVVIPTYNAPDLFRETLKSVYSQTELPGEILVIDDGSDLQYPQITHDSTLIKFVRKDHEGLSAAWNHAIKMAGGEWIAFLDHDDLWHPEKLERQLRQATDRFDVVFCQRQRFLSDSDEAVNTPAYRAEFCAAPVQSLMKSFFATPSTILIRKELFKSVERFDSTLLSCADYDMWIRLALKGARFNLVDEVLVKKRVSESSIQGQQLQVDKMHFVLKALEKNATAIQEALSLSPAEWACRMGFNLGFFFAEAGKSHDAQAIEYIEARLSELGSNAAYAARLRAREPTMCVQPWYAEEDWSRIQELLARS